MEERVNETGMENYCTVNYMNEEGHKKATASMILGILSVVFPGVIGLVLGIIGLVEASKAKKLGNTEGNRTAGFVLSLVGLIYSGITILVFIACFATISAFITNYLYYGMNYYPYFVD